MVCVGRGIGYPAERSEARNFWVYIFHFSGVSIFPGIHFHAQKPLLTSNCFILRFYSLIVQYTLSYMYLALDKLIYISIHTLTPFKTDIQLYTMHLQLQKNLYTT